MAMAESTRQLVSAVASEMACGIEAAVERWMTLVDEAVSDTRLDPSDRVQSVLAVLRQYKLMTGKQQLLGCGGT